MLWWPIYTIMNSSSFINTNPIYSRGYFLPARRICPASNGSRSRLSDMDSCKPAFMSGAPRSASSSLRGPSSQAVTLIGGARFIAWRFRCPFLVQCPRRVWAMALRLEPPKKGFVPHSSSRWDKWQIPTSSRQFRTDTSTCCTNTLILYIFSVLFSTLVPPTFSSSVSSFCPHPSTWHHTNLSWWL